MSVKILAICQLSVNPIHTLLKALNEFKNEKSKSPGTDGLQAEFYKHFWEELHADMLQCFDYAYDSGKLSISQRRGSITLIPKPNKDTTVLVDNLRPISLLNTDYKILTKVIAKRLEKVLPRIINPDQTGYIKNRYIGENVRLLSDIMNYTEENNIPGMRGTLGDCQHRNTAAKNNEHRITAKKVDMTPTPQFNFCPTI